MFSNSVETLQKKKKARERDTRAFQTVSVKQDVFFPWLIWLFFCNIERFYDFYFLPS